MFALSLGFGAVILATEIAFSQPQCDARETVVALLADRWGETRRALGLAGDSAMMELFANDTTGTWSVTLTLPDGRMCLMASGDSYEAVVEDLPAPGPRI
jgi:hypothetical protein